MARVLVYTPTYDDMLAPETVASVKAQQFNGELVWEIDDRNLHEGRSMLEVCEKYRDARQMALDGGYDALMCVEHDMVLPDGCIQALWDTVLRIRTGKRTRLQTEPALVVYAAYMLRHGVYVINLFRYEGRQNIGSSLSLFPQDYKRMRRRKFIEVSGGGFGATLIRREALERVPFRMFQDNPPDMAFAADCVRAGIRQIGRFDVACLHIDERGIKLGIDDTEVCRVEALQNVTILNLDHSIEMKRGRYYTVYRVAAEEHARAGYVRISDNSVGARETAEAPVVAELADKPVVKRRKPGGRPAAAKAS